MLTDTEFEAVSRLVLRANRAAAARLPDLRGSVDSLLIACGLSDDGEEFGQSFREFSGSEFDHGQAAAQLRLIVAAKNPAAMICASKATLSALWVARHRQDASDANSSLPSRDPETADFLGALHSYKFAIAELRAALHRWERANGMPETNLPLSSELRRVGRAKQAMVRKLARKLAKFHRSLVLQHRPTKTALDTLVIELANIFAGCTGFEQDRHLLPHAKKSRFIKFCHAVLEPYFHGTEVSHKALSGRWKRLKDDEVGAQAIAAT